MKKTSTSRTRNLKRFGRTKSRNSHTRDYRSLSTKARLLTFRAFTAQKAVTLKNMIQTSHAAALAVRSEQVRLTEGRYYRTRAKLRLPNQRVRRSERKREGLRLFARHTLKRPQTIAGRGKLLLPAANAYTAVP